MPSVHEPTGIARTIWNSSPAWSGKTGAVLPLNTRHQELSVPDAISVTVSPLVCATAVDPRAPRMTYTNVVPVVKLTSMYSVPIWITKLGAGKSVTDATVSVV